jgi:hypothetical protein
MVALHSHRRCKSNTFIFSRFSLFSDLIRQLSVAQATGALWGGLKASVLKS